MGHYKTWYIGPDDIQRDLHVLMRCYNITNTTASSALHACTGTDGSFGCYCNARYRSDSAHESCGY